MKIQVPEGMLRVAWKATAAKMMERIDAGDHSGVPELHVARVALEAALSWLSENPIAPNGEQMAALNATAEGARLDPSFKTTRWYIVEWQRRMFLAPEKDSLYDSILDAALAAAPTDADGVKLYTSDGVLLAEAFRRGKEGR